MSAQKYLDRIENREIGDPFTYSRKEMVDFAEKYHKEQLRIGGVSQRSELFCKCTTDTDIYQSDGYIKCQTCYNPIKVRNCG